MSGVLAGGLLGLFGSLHCLGMCGPLALALPGAGVRGARYVLGRLLYNAGRVLLYTLLGAVIGLAGGIFRVSGTQQWLSVGVGALMLIGVLFSTSLTSLFTRIPGLAAVDGALRKHLSALFSRSSFAALFLIGILNGFLPCGLVYVALGAAATSGGPAEAALFMAGFGLGTVPAMLGAALFGGRIGGRLRARFSRAVPVVIGLVAVLLILRGLNRGIPYLSPRVEPEKEEVDCCH